MTDDTITTTAPAPAGPRERFFTWPRTRRGPYGWPRAAAGLGLLIALCIGIATALGLATAGDEKVEPWLAVVRLGLPVALWIVPVLIVARVVFSMRPADLISHRPGMRWGLFGRSLVVALVAYAALFAGQVVVRDQQLHTSPAVLLGLAAVLLIIPFQAAAEELVFRGLGTQVVLGRTGYSHAAFWGVTAVLSALFMALHASASPAVLAALVTFAVVFSFLTWRLAGLEAAMAIHIANNVLFTGGALLRGENLQAKQSDATFSFAGVAVQLAVTVAVGLAILWMARRERDEDAPEAAQARLSRA